MILALVIVLICIATMALVLAGVSIRVLREYERGVVFRLGRLIEQKGPGVVLLVPVSTGMVRVSLRTVTLQIPPQEVITRDNVPARVTAVAYFRVVDPGRRSSRSRMCSPRLRRSRRRRCARCWARPSSTRCSPSASGSTSTSSTSSTTRPSPGASKSPRWRSRMWRSPSEMQHSMARQAEAERERRAKVIDAEGEFQAAAKLAEAAELISRNPVTIQLRYLQTLREIGGNQNSTIVFPFRSTSFSRSSAPHEGAAPASLRGRSARVSTRRSRPPERRSTPRPTTARRAPGIRRGPGSGLPRTRAAVTTQPTRQPAQTRHAPISAGTLLRRNVWTGPVRVKDREDRVLEGDVEVRRGEHVHATEGDIRRVQGFVIDRPIITSRTSSSTKVTARARRGSPFFALCRLGRRT